MGRKDTGTSQIFVNLRRNEFDWWTGGAVQSVVFGRVVSGLEVVDAIAASKTAGKLFGDRPLEPIRVTSVKLAP
jgi:cyclophilin family peptidyl-prolyl cis-trans isomerase